MVDSFVVFWRVHGIFCKDCDKTLGQKFKGAAGLHWRVERMQLEMIYPHTVGMARLTNYLQL